MFTGLVAEQGRVQRVSPFGNGSRFTIEALRALEGAEIGDSISINGVCLTVTGVNAGTFSADAVEETLKKSTLGHLVAGARVNLEPALRAGGKLGGHFVQGHVDRTVRVKSIEHRAESWLFTFELPDEDRALITPRGSVAIDGVSLTVAEKKSAAYTVSVIPHTFQGTLFSQYTEGTLANVEYDILGKYIIGYLSEVRSHESRITPDFLEGLGY